MRRLQTLARVVAATVLASAIGVVVAPAAEAAPCTDPFTAEFRASVASALPDQRVTAAVHDTRTGCWYHLNRGMQVGTASVIKAQFLAGALLRAQDQGRGLSPTERGWIDPMITYSFNPQASALFTSLGGVAGMDAIDRRFGLTATTHLSQWGGTLTTAEDRTRLALAMLHGGGPLGAAGRAAAWSFMGDVHGSQQWGVSAGVPAGWSIALKNGFFPVSGTPAWRVGSTGFVRDDLTGEGYAITVMSDRNPDHVVGQFLVDWVSLQVATTLTTGASAPRLVERSRCATAFGGESWSRLAARIGGTTAGAVQTASGGTSNPVAGMRACALDFSPPPPPNPDSTIDGVYEPLVGDFDGDGTSDALWYRPGGGADYVWFGETGGSFTSRRVSVNGHYQPLVGDFDGDGTTDVLWYRPGPGSDHLWSGRADRTFASVPQSVQGSYQPLVGDFDGDGTTDVLWYRPGPASDHLWAGGDGSRFTSSRLSVIGSYEPFVGDFDGNGTTDVFWYRPGPSADYVWPGGLGGGFGSVRRDVGGDYLPTVADLDGDGLDDIVWSGALDSTWWATSTEAPTFVSERESIGALARPAAADLDGDAGVEVLFDDPGSGADVLFDGRGRRPVELDHRVLPLAGDFDGDGRGDLLLYGRGHATDLLWLGTADAAAPRVVTPSG